MTEGDRDVYPSHPRELCARSSSFTTSDEDVGRPRMKETVWLSTSQLPSFAWADIFVEALRHLNPTPRGCYCVGHRYNNMSRPVDLVQGTLDALLLQTLALEPLHGLAVAQRMRARSGDVLNVSRGSLYPALHKLEQQGLLRSEWRLSESGKRAKYYSLTRAGKRHLAREQKDWDRLSAAISMVLKPS
jgi:PadR family transcriptional regulator